MKTAEQWMKEWSTTPNTVLISTACWIEAIQADAREESKKELELLKKDKERLESACQLTLDFHSAAEWNDEKRLRWITLLTFLLGPASTRKNENGYHYKVGFIASCDEATTKNLCNAVRAAMRKET